MNGMGLEIFNVGLNDKEREAINTCIFQIQEETRKIENTKFLVFKEND